MHFQQRVYINSDEILSQTSMQNNSMGKVY